MRRVRYSVAVSLDGFIAGPKGEYDWIISDPEIDFRALFAQFAQAKTAPAASTPSHADPVKYDVP